MNKEFFKGTSSLVGTIIGAGIFGMPFVVAKAGFGIGTIFLVVLTALMLILHLMFAEVVEHTKGKHRLIGYTEIYFGKVAKKMVSMFAIIGVYGSLVVYILLANEFLNTLFDTPHNNFTWGFLFWILLSAGIIMGIKTIGKAEVFMMGLLAFTVLVIILRGAPLISLENYLNYDLSNLFLPYGVIMFSLAGFAAVPEIKDFFKRGDKSYRNSVAAGVIISALIAFIFTAVVVGVSGTATSSDAIGGLLPYLGKEIVYFGSIFGVLAVATSYLMIGIYLKDSFIYDLKLSRIWSDILLILVPILLIIAGIKNFIVVLGFTGAVLGAIDGSVIALLFLKARQGGVKMIHLPLKFPIVWAGAIIFVLIAGGAYTILSLLTN